MKVTQLFGHVALASVLLAAPVACSPAAEELQPGEVYTPASGEATGRSTVLRIPTGALTVTVADPVAETDGRRAPDGYELVRVNWVLDELGGRRDVWQLMARAEEPAPSRVVLRTGDERIPLGAATGRGDRVVAVSEDSPAAGIDVVYDGVTQRLDTETGTVEKNGAAGMYRRGQGQRPTDCDRLRPDPPFGATALECSVSTMRVPYVPGAGWAADSGDWWVVSASLSAPWFTYRRGGIEATYGVERAVDRSRLGGRRAEVVLDASSSSTGSDVILVFPDTGTDESAFQLSWQYQLALQEVQSGRSAPNPATAVVSTRLNLS